LDALFLSQVLNRMLFSFLRSHRFDFVEKLLKCQPAPDINGTGEVK
jgi:hypothetical protein